MIKQELLGKITFINHDKHYAMIEYEENGKKKTIKGSLSAPNLGDTNQKKHKFSIDDVVSFVLHQSGKNEKTFAGQISFLYNNSMDVVINKARQSNQLTGFIKQVDDQFFVKESTSYIFFPLEFSSWQILPTADEMEHLVDFKLNHLEKKEKITASLLNNNYLPEYKLAVKHQKSRKPVMAVVSKVSIHAIYLDLFEGKIQSKITLEKSPAFAETLSSLKQGDELQVLITHTGKNRIVTQPLAQGDDQA